MKKTKQNKNVAREAELLNRKRVGQTVSNANPKLVLDMWGSFEIWHCWCPLGKQSLFKC